VANEPTALHFLSARDRSMGMRHRIGMACALAGVLFSTHGRMRADDAAARREVADMVAASIRHNYEPLTSLRATIRLVKVVPPSIKPGTTTRPVSGGGTITFTVLPVQETITNAYLRGDEQYYDVSDPVNPARQWIKDGVVTNWQARHQLVVTGPNRPEYYSQFPNFDPRELAFWKSAYRPLLLIETAELQAAAIEPDGSARVEVTDDKGTTVVFHCAAKSNFLPTSIYQRDTDRSILFRAELEYQQVMSEPRPVWLLAKMVQRFPLAKITDLDSEQWTKGEMTVATTTVTDVKVGEPIADDVFTIPAFADHTFVRNFGDANLNHRVGVTTAASPPAPLWGNPWLVFNLLVVLALAALVLWFRMVRPRLQTKGAP
jgi:hypothetical protein